MKGKARLRMLPMLAAAAVVSTTTASAASDRFVPGDPGFVVANISRSAPDEELRPLVAAWQADPTGVAAATLAAAYLERARSRREPMFVGRAEAVLERAARGPGATHAHARLYAETLQYRHDFSAAERLLDGVLRADPRDSTARTQRASVRLVRGDFAGARADCGQLLAGGDAASPIGAACLAEALAGTGDLDRARALLRMFPVATGGRDAAPDPVTHAYLLTVRGELGERAAGEGDLDAAIADYARALELQPGDDSIRASLADALAARGDRRAALSAVAVERPSLALLTRAALYAPDAQRGNLAARATALLALETARGDAAHAREAAMLALAAGDAPRSLDLARANFTTQRELADVRVLARAAAAARSAGDLRALRAWLAETGFADAVTERVLADAARR
jgi:tetratricopeptide (TPR) repeat protein